MSEPSAIVAKLLESVAKEAGSRAWNVIFGGASKLGDSLRLNFSDYLDSAVERTRFIKTLLHRDSRVELLSIYVETFLKSNNKIIRDNILIDAIRKSVPILVIGSAGAGKTMFIRYTFLHLLEGSFGIIPLFIELRGLNSLATAINLVQFIYDTVVRPGAVVKRDQFDKCLGENMFILILDGLDEVEHDRRLAVETQITHLREAYPKLGIVVTSRPDDRLSGWVDFMVCHIQPMKQGELSP